VTAGEFDALVADLVATLPESYQTAPALTFN
jgi:hypothetical protein